MFISWRKNDERNDRCDFDGPGEKRDFNREVKRREAISIVAGCFKGKDLTTVNSHTVHYGHIFDESGIIDEVLVSVFRAPRTYTREDIVEIGTHGGFTLPTAFLN